MVESDFAVQINLPGSYIEVLEPCATLLFEGKSPRYYLYSIALVAHEMKRHKTSDNNMPFVQVSSFLDRLTKVAEQLNIRFESEDSMAESLYHTWRKRLHPSGTGSKYRSSFRLSDLDKVALRDLFETEEGKAGRRARYRIRSLPEEILIVEDSLFQQLHETPLIPASESTLQTPSDRVTPLHLPIRPYYFGLTGHENHLADATALLASSSAPRSLLITGMGGLGKTTLAIELARRIIQKSSDRQAYWVRADGVPQENVDPIDYYKARIGSELVLQLGLLDRLDLMLAGMVEGIRETEGIRNAVLIVDNLEPRPEVGHLARWILETFPVACCILTSRTSFDIPDCHTLRVLPLDPTDSEAFVRTDARRRGLEGILPSNSLLLRELGVVAGGLPFAIQLALGRASRIPWMEVLGALRSTPTELYEYLFRDLWGLLTPLEQKLLIYMRTAPDGIPFEEFLESGVGSQNDTIAALDVLVKLSLVNVAGLDAMHAEYSIHPLTLDFIVSDLPRLWSGE